MNIIVKPYGSELCHCRPDTTWERENRDFYSPECVNEITWSPVIFARISKAGKCVSGKFVERYYDGVGCGMLMYGVAAASSEGLPQTSACIDHSSILPTPLYNPAVIEDDKEFTLSINGEATAVALKSAKSLMEETICKASQLTSLRIGDYVAAELQAPVTLASRKSGEAAVKGSFCENEIFNFKIIF